MRYWRSLLASVIVLGSRAVIIQVAAAAVDVSPADDFDAQDDDGSNTRRLRRQRHPDPRATLDSRRHVDSALITTEHALGQSRRAKKDDQECLLIPDFTDPLNQKLPSILVGLVRCLDKGTATNPVTLSLIGVSSDDMIALELVVKPGIAVEDLAKEASRYGFERTGTFGRIISGRISTLGLSSLIRCSCLLFVLPSLSATQTGSVTSEGDQAIYADVARAKYGVDGTGITVGSLSDAYNCLGGAANDIATGNLPPANRINILQELSGCRGAIDEGRAMMQVIHDVAKGVNQAFHTAYGGQAVFAQGILDLANAGCDIIVDDIIYFAEPMFMDGIIAQAAQQVAEAGVPYFSAAGNHARASYEAPFLGSGVFGSYGGERHNFDNTGNTVVDLMPVDATEYGIIVFQWDEPYPSAGAPTGSRSDLQILLLDRSSGEKRYGGILNNIGLDPIEAFGFAPGSYDLEIIVYDGPPPSLMKLIVLLGTDFTFDHTFASRPEFNAGTSYGHANAATVAAVGASGWDATPRFGQSPPILQEFSSAGGVPILFDVNGNRLSSPIIREKPLLIGPDGGVTTFFASQNQPGNRFFGTSASAPHIAAVAALILDVDNELSTDAIYDVLKTTAIDMDVDGFDFDTGYGFVNASAALSKVSTTPQPSTQPTISPTRALTVSPTRLPTDRPTRAPSRSPSKSPTPLPTHFPTNPPTSPPSGNPTMRPTCALSTKSPTGAPSRKPSNAPTPLPTHFSTSPPTSPPSSNPTMRPTNALSTKSPTGSPTITEDTDAEPGDYPWFVKYGDCGGTLIHPDIVLTAARCNGASSTAFVGSYDITQSAAFGTEEITIVAGAVHPQFSSSTFRNDVLVFKLSSSSSKATVALNSNTNVPADGDEMLLLGYGMKNKMTGQQATVLQEILIPLIPDAFCRANYWGPSVQADVMFCAGSDARFPNVCNRKKGNPLLREVANGSYEQVGILSWGELNCFGLGRPAIYAEVAPLKSWIDEQICSLSENPPANCPPPPAPPAGAVRVRIDIIFDNWPGETGWYIFDDGVEIVSRPRGTYFVARNGRVGEAFWFLPGEYTIMLTDSYGDGFCCDYGEGHVEIYAEVNGSDILLAYVSGSFASSFTGTFPVPNFGP